MERIFEGEIYEIVPQPNGIVFSYCKGSSDDRVLVAYKMISLDNGTITDVAKNIYLLSKFGSNYRFALPHCGNYITAKSIVLPSGRSFFCDENGIATFLDADGTILWNGELTYRGAVPADLAVYQGALWACYSQSGVLLRFNLNSVREELRIGGTENSPFDHPQDIFIDGDTAVISNIGSNKLLRVNLGTYTVEEFHEFTEPVYSYAKIKNYDFVLMKSGLYII